MMWVAFLLPQETVETFDQAAFKTQLLALVHAAPTDLLSYTVVPASVRVDARILFVDADAAHGARNTLLSSYFTVQLSAQLGATVQAMADPRVTLAVFPAPSPPPSPPPPSPPSPSPPPPSPSPPSSPSPWLWLR